MTITAQDDKITLQSILIVRSKKPTLDLGGKNMMKQITLNTEHIGRMLVGVKTPIIQTGDPLIQIGINSCLKAAKHFHTNAVIAFTEAVVAIAQGNYASPEDIQADIARKFPGQSDITLLFPIQSRNRFMNIPRAIAAMDEIKRINIVLQYPCDEVGNRLISDEALMASGVNPYEDIFTASDLYQRFDKPNHIFTGKDYIKEFQLACNGKANVVLANNPKSVCDMSKNVIVCTIREGKRKLHRQQIYQCGNDMRVFTLADILNESINGSGYSPEYGLYGSNMMANGYLKLMPRDCQQFVEEVQAQIMKYYGVHVEVMVYGDGAFKDPVGEIWELADPIPTLGATSGLRGTPEEVKLKFLASQHAGLSSAEIEKIIAKAKKERIANADITGEASLGTTPRQKTDILASAADLTSGSGDQQTPIVYMMGYLD